MNFQKIIIVLFMIWFGTACSADDYYTTLGVAKDASLKEIRKAFKKLALTMHPDKNVNDPEAHDKFVRINNIYEVLKDEETREKYDKYGEEGLKDDHRGGGRYESYSYYRDEFGIYDDDADVVTLDGSDFDAAIKSGEAWFVNFYSPRCSHCHELAPTWRKFAEEMSGVVNIGAVNCFDNRWTCNENGIHSYPSLVMYMDRKNPIKYQGDRRKKDLIKFVMQYVNVEVIDMWDGNWEKMVKKAPGLPWVVSFCSGESDHHDNGGDADDDEESAGNCPSDITKTKLAGLLNKLANVGSVDCDDSGVLCRRVARDGDGIYFFPAGGFPGDDAAPPRKFASLDAREVYGEYMRAHMPGLRVFSHDKLKGYVRNRAILTFLQFSTDQADEKETNLKKLPALLERHTIAVAKVQCSDSSWCKDNLHMSEDSTLLFKGNGLDDYEVYHGRLNTAELSAFAQESAEGRVSTLNPTHFGGGQLLDKSQPWFVDFFAPWCPPCRALLPELRKASVHHQLRTIRFGTVDCTKFSQVCTQFGIHSYPTTMLFNQTDRHQYRGHHNSWGIAQFVEDLIHPPYEHLTPSTFQSSVLQREPGITWVVDFYANWCGPCRALLPEWRKMAKMLTGVVRVGAIDCAKKENQQTCQLQQVDGYPEIRLFPSKKKANSKPLYQVFQGWQRQAHVLSAWVLKLVPEIEVRDMKFSDFVNGVPNDDEAWVLDFYAPWCGPCMAFAPKFSIVSARFVGRVKFGKVNCQQMSSVCNMNNLQAYPTLIFYPPVATNLKRAKRKTVDSQEPEEITAMLERLIQPYANHQKTTAGKTAGKSKDEL